MRARAPSTPSRTQGVPLWSPEVDIRMWSACTYNFWNGEANACVMDEDITVDDAGAYALVVSAASKRPVVAVPARGVTWLDAGRFLDGQINFRMLLGSGRFLTELKAAIQTGEASPEIAPYVPQTAHCSRAAFEAGGFAGCASGWRGASR